MTNTANKTGPVAAKSPSRATEKVRVSLTASEIDYYRHIIAINRVSASEFLAIALNSLSPEAIKRAAAEVQKPPTLVANANDVRPSAIRAIEVRVTGKILDELRSLHKTLELPTMAKTVGLVVSAHLAALKAGK